MTSFNPFLIISSSGCMSSSDHDANTNTALMMVETQYFLKFRVTVALFLATRDGFVSLGHTDSS